MFKKIIFLLFLMNLISPTNAAELNFCPSINNRIADPNIFFNKGIEYFTQKQSVIHKCEAIYNFELMACYNYPIVAELLDALYLGDWVLIAALEGNALARIKLVEKRLLKAKHKKNTIKKLNSKLFYEELLSLLNLDKEENIPLHVTKTINDLKLRIYTNMNDEGLTKEMVNSSYIKPKNIICIPRKFNSEN